MERMTTNASDEFTSWLCNRSDAFQKWFNEESEEGFKCWLKNNHNNYSIADQHRLYQRCLQLVWTNGIALKHVPGELRGDKLIVHTAVGNNGLALEFATPDLQGDEQIVLEAVGNDSRAIQFASPHLRGDKQFVLSVVGAAIDKNGTEAVANAIERSQGDKMVLTVLQSSPLVYEIVEDGDPYPLGVLDFEEEEKALQETLKDTEVQLQFEAATEKNLNKLIPTGNVSMLHFSGHGNDKCIWFENPNGSGIEIKFENENVKDLKNMIDKGGRKLKFAFISTCQSRHVGQAFIKAGVEHVICMERDDQLLHHGAAGTFARDFYNALANDKTIQQAFDSAKSNPFVQQEEREKFALLPEGGHDITLRQMFPFGNSGNTAATSASSAMAPTLLPKPPKLFLQREVEMYKVIKSMIEQGKGGKGERLVRVTGEPGIGIESFCAAVGIYMERRRMYGEVYWVSCEPRADNRDVSSKLSQALQIIKNYKGTTESIPADQGYGEIRENIANLTKGLLVREQAVVIIDSKEFKGIQLMLLSRFLSELLTCTEGKFLVFHRKEHRPEPPDDERGFPNCLTARGEEVVLKNLDLIEAVRLFGRHCKHAKNMPSSWSDEYMKHRCSHYFKTVKDFFLCNGIPKKIISLAQNMEEPMYNAFVGQIKLSDFQKAAGDPSTHQGGNPSTHQGGNEEALFVRDIRDGSYKKPPPPVKTQNVIRAQFVDILKTRGKLHRKSATAYIRAAKKGETVVTLGVDGKPDTQVTVADDSSKVVRGKVGEEYVLTEKQFLDNYDASSSRPIPEEAEEEHIGYLRQNEFREYDSKRRLIWAKEVSKDDITWFRGGDSSSDSANYLAPWGTKDRIKVFDYLVMPQEPAKQNAGVDVEVYRISKDVFEETYVEELGTTANEDIDTKTGVSDDSRTDMIPKKTEDRIMVYQPFGLLQAFQLLGSRITSVASVLVRTPESGKRKLQEEMRVLEKLEKEFPEIEQECRAKRLRKAKELLDLI